MSCMAWLNCTTGLNKNAHAFLCLFWDRTYCFNLLLHKKRYYSVASFAGVSLVFGQIKREMSLQFNNKNVEKEESHFSGAS
jgi:hypothetical protein